jgi:interferon-induced GTP-binding protein Mx1
MLSNEFILEHAKPWLLFLEGLQNLGISPSQLTVPQIAVFGDQSSGKSSLLESISGIPFPKGTGLVTKCPTRISMVHLNGPDEDGYEWSANVVLPDHYKDLDESLTKTVYNPSELAAILSEASNIITNNSLTGFSREVIHVNVRSSQVPDLSLIDLPGIIRTTTAGQHTSVISEVNSLLQEYMSQKETIILAIIPANQDIATIDILERAHSYDPKGERTIGVLTKPDLIDKGGEEEVLKIIQNIRKPLKLGYIMVKNRNQLELKSSHSLENALKDEETYFQSHEIWKLINLKSRGIKSLCNKLTMLIVSHAMERGPFLKYQLLEKQKEMMTLLSDLGATDIPTDDNAKRKLLIKLITRYTQTLRQVCNGDYRDPIPTKHEKYRLKYYMNANLSQLENNLKEAIPDFNSKEYALKLKDSISTMRGRLVFF